MTNRVDITVRLNDQASSGFARLEQNTRAIQQRMAQDAQRTGQANAHAAQQAQDAHVHAYQAIARAAQQATQQQQNAHVQAYRAITDARDRLNMRGHGQITADIAATRAAYQTLATSGVMSWREQQQAAERMHRTIRELTNEMGRLTAAQRAHQGLQMGAGVVGGLAGGAVGAGMALRNPVNNALTFDQRMAYLANTAYPEADTAGRQRGAKELEAAIHAAVKAGGGTPDKASTLLEEIIGGGVLDKRQALQRLPDLTRTMTANNADPYDVAALVNKLYGNGIVKNGREEARAMNMIVAAGQAGGFEFKDLAKYLPEQIGIGKSAGLTGLPGLQKILVLNEAAVMTAGTRDIAGRNVFNYLSKISSSDTAKDFERMGRGDLGDYLMRQRAKGVDAVDVWQRIIEQELGKDPQLNAMRKKLATSTDKGEQKNLIEGISELAKGNVIVNYFQDMQAKNALLAYQNTELVNRANQIIGQNNVEQGGASDRNFAPVMQTNAYKVNAVTQFYEEQQKKLMDTLTPKVGAAADYAMQWGQQHPTAAKAAAAAPWAAGSAAGAVGGWWALQRFMPAAAPAAGAAAPGIMAQLTPAIARASQLFGNFTTSASAFLARAPGLATTARATLAPYAPLAARATGVGAAAVTGYQVGGLINSGIDRVLSDLTGKTNTLGGYIYDLTHPEPVEIKPIQVDTKSQLTVTLSPGLVPSGQSSTSTSNAQKGNNTSIMFAGKRGNLWEDAP